MLAVHKSVSLLFQKFKVERCCEVAGYSLAVITVIREHKLTHRDRGAWCPGSHTNPAGSVDLNTCQDKALYANKRDVLCNVD